MNTSPYFFGQSLAHQLAALAACACIITGAQAVADAPQLNVRTVKVSYADLDITTGKGSAVLYGRIRRAASRVCAPLPAPREIRRYQQWKECQSSAISNAVATVNQPVLTAMHRSRTGQPTSPAVVAQSPQHR
jgi:UrcA family protein